MSEWVKKWEIVFMNYDGDFYHFVVVRNKINDQKNVVRYSIELYVSYDEWNEFIWK